ncbi:MAG: hypothetical protein ABR505_03035 [Actinomycetota bacterium]
MSPDVTATAGVLLLTVTAVEFGGLSLLKLIARRDPGYLDNPVRRYLFRAGHAHAGVFVIVALIGLLYLEAAALPPLAKDVVRVSFVVAPILMPLGFFLSVVSPNAERPNGLIALVYLGGLSLAIGAVGLGIGLVRA